MTQATTGYLDLGDGKLYYEVAGEGEPLVLSHAGFVDSRMWDDQWSFFTKHYRVIRFDMRGFGKSDRAAAPVARRDDLSQLLRHLNITQAILLGCSVSGEIMLDYALEHPQLVAALVLISATPSGFELQGEPPPHLIEMITAIQEEELTLASELQNRIWIDGPFRQPEQVDPRVRERATEMNRIALINQTLSNLYSAPGEALDPPAVQRLSEIHVPTLIIAGGLDHPEILRAADEMAAAIAGAQKALVPDTAHLPNMERPALFNQLVLDFLRHR